MIKLLISIFLLLLIYSCNVDDKEVSGIFKKLSNEKKEDIDLDNLIIKYHIGDPYSIDGVKYIPKENYKYDEVGLATFYGKELHNTRTINNDTNKVTELLGRHKTLPIPSVVKVTNLDNGLSLVIKIVDRHNYNSSLIQVSRKSAMLLKFYKNKIAKVRVQILYDPSKQMKVVTKSMNESGFSTTVSSAPTEAVSISNIENFNIEDVIPTINSDQPIEIGYENIDKNKLLLKIYNFKTYEEAKKTFTQLKLDYKFVIQNEGDSYSLILGPLENIEANNLVSTFISRGYKETEFIVN